MSAELLMPHETGVDGTDVAPYGDEVGCPLRARIANYSISIAKELYMDAGASTTGDENSGAASISP